jgi:hypothetical protein
VMVGHGELEVADGGADVSERRAPRPNSRASRRAWLLTETTSLRPRMGNTLPFTAPTPALREDSRGSAG